MAKIGKIKDAVKKVLKKGKKGKPGPGEKRKGGK